MYLKLKEGKGKLVTNGLVIEPGQIKKVIDGFFYDKDILEEVKIVKNDENKLVETYETTIEVEEKVTGNVEVPEDDEIKEEETEEKVVEEKEEKKIYTKKELNDMVRIKGFFGFRKWAKEMFGTTDRKKAQLIKEILEIQKNRG